MAEVRDRIQYQRPAATESPKVVQWKESWEDDQPGGVCQRRTEGKWWQTSRREKRMAQQR
eukprot:scaffold1109_cov90-Amphora_coffeaeformis.AAC.2